VCLFFLEPQHNSFAISIFYYFDTILLIFHYFTLRYVNEFNASHTKSGNSSSSSTTSSGQTEKTNTAGSSSTSSGSKQGGATGGGVLWNIQLYLYSSVDDRIDCISFCPQALANARIV
jgi:hypothetical protein